MKHLFHLEVDFVFRSIYIGKKRHKFGIQIFKLCLKDGYTFNFQIYCGKDKSKSDVSVPTKVVMDLMSNLLNKGTALTIISQ